MTSYFQDGGHDVISHRKVLPSGECSLSDYQFLICSTYMSYILVLQGDVNFRLQISDDGVISWK